MTRRILITGGRSPYTLTLARKLAEAGHTVVTAESIPFSLTNFSRSVAKKYRVPSPRFQEQEFIQALGEIIRGEKIDFLFPTCEEIFYIAKHREQLPTSCEIFCDSFEKLTALHNKYQFITRAASYGCTVPLTSLVTSQEELEQALNTIHHDVILKPTYSRFAEKVIHYSPSDKIPNLTFTQNNPWLVQEKLKGTPFCTFGVVRDGLLLAHTAYEVELAWNNGSALTLKHTDHREVLHWVQEFVGKEKFTGCISFDFFETDLGIVPIECNPRPTIGLVLFSDHERFADTFFDILALQEPGETDTFTMRLSLYVQLMNAPSKQVMEQIVMARDCVWDLRDPIPAIGQYILLAYGGTLALAHQMSLTEAATYDLEYNG